MKKIILTGGGTAGHVNPNLALVPLIKNEGIEIHYVGGKNGMEKELVAAEGIPFYGISGGKLRRYLSFKNFTDIFRIMKGFFESLLIIKKIKPAVIFSKGGFIAVPVVAAGWLMRVPVIIHESDMTMGLANKLSSPFATIICCTFYETLKISPHKKMAQIGAPIRKELFEGDAEAGRKICGFGADGHKPVLLVIGGSLGSKKLNEAVRDALPELLIMFDVIHVCGAGNTDDDYNANGYVQFEYVRDEFPHLLAAADLIVSRAGANTIVELLSLKKPALLIPLPLSQSRGDQIINAEFFEKKGFAAHLPEEFLTADSLIKKLKNLYDEKEKYISAMDGESYDGTETIAKLLINIVRRGHDFLGRG